MSKFWVGLGIVLASIGAYLLITLPTPTRAQLENPYGDPGGGLQKVGGWACLGAGVLILGAGIVRMLRAPRHDPDLPPEHRV